MTPSTRIVHIPGPRVLLVCLLVVASPFLLYGQGKKVITGIVYDNQIYSPLSEVKVVEEGTANEVTTGLRGEYSIEVERGGTLIFSHPQYNTRKVLIKPGPKNTNIVARLDPLSHDESRPNVIFILADDLGWSQTGAFGSHYYRTPNIDRLAREGMRFTRAYAAASVCSPSRASIMTGKYPARLHLTDYIPGLKPEGMPLTTPEWQRFLPLQEYTLGELFKAAGYHTAMFGKWHLSIAKQPPASAPYNPDKQGFDEFMITYKPHGGPHPTDPEHDPHMSDSIGNRSVEFLKNRPAKPFFLFMSFNAVHDPPMERADSIAAWTKLEGSRLPENNPVIAAMLKRMDDNIGKVLRAVDSLGLKSNTLIVFFSDNGGLEADASQTPLRRGKGWFYEGGIREPLIVRWPGVVVPGAVSNTPVCSIDFLPTFADVLSMKAIPQVDGISILPVLKNTGSLPARNLYWHYPHYMSALDAVPHGAIRKGKWKLIEWYEKSLAGDLHSAYELYDVETDQGETVNLADDMKALTKELASDLAAWRLKVKAQMPSLNKSIAEHGK